MAAARLAADVLGVPTVIIGRTDVNSAAFITSDFDERDSKHVGKRSTETGYYYFNGGLKASIDRGIAYAPHVDLIWFETSTPDIEEARTLARGVKKEFPEMKFAYNLSSSFDFTKYPDDYLHDFMDNLAQEGFKFLFNTLGGFHLVNLSAFEFSRAFLKDGILAYKRLQENEIENEKYGYRARRHQAFVGTKYFDQIKTTVSRSTETLAFTGSTEEKQFKD